MPTYSYRCTECSNAFDIHQAFTDDSLTVCPVCGGQLRKVFGTVGVTFNGSGFYRTDSRAGNEKSGSSSSSAPASKPAKSESSGTSGSASGSSSGSGSGSSGSSSSSSASGSASAAK